MKLKIMIMALLLLVGIGSAVNWLPESTMERGANITFQDGGGIEDAGFVNTTVLNADSMGPTTVYGDLNIAGGGNITFSGGHVINGSYEFNPKDFGAVGDGVHDDAGAIQSCIDTAHAEYITSGVHQVVKIPPGDYSIATSAASVTNESGEILLNPRPGVNIVGSGIGVTTFIAPPDYRSPLHGVSLLFNPTESFDGWEISDITFDYGSDRFETGDAFATRIGATYCRDVLIENVEVKNASGSWCIVLGPGSEDNWSENCEITGCRFTETGTAKSDDHSWDFCTIYMSMSNASIHDNVFINSVMPKNATSAIEMHNSNIRVYNNYIYNYRQGIHCGAIKDDNSTSTGQMIFCNHIVAYDCIMIWSYPSESRVSDIMIINNKLHVPDGFDGQGINRVDAYFTGTGDSIVIVSNEVERTGGVTSNSPGIMMGEFENIVIKENTVHGFTRGIQIEDAPSSKLIDITENTIYDYGYGYSAGRYTSGIVVDAGGSTGDLIIKRNNVQGDGTAQNPYGIYINTNVTRSWIEGNTIAGAQDADFAITSVGTLFYLNHASQSHTAPACGSDGSWWTDLSTGTIYRRTGGAWSNAFP